MTEPWPERIIDLPDRVKLELACRDPGRYVEQCRAEREVEAAEIVRERLAEALRRWREARRRLPWWRRLGLG